MPPGGDRFALDEDPADETMAPAPRLTGRSSQELRSAEPRGPEPRPIEPRAAEPPPPLAPMMPAHEPRHEPRAPEPRSAFEPPRAPQPTAHRDGAPSLGFLAALLDEPGVLEVVVEGTRPAIVDRGNGLTPSLGRFGSIAEAMVAAAHLFEQANLALGDDPIQEASLPDGWHLTLILAPVAVSGPLFELRRIARPAVPGEALVSQGMLSSDMLALLRSALEVQRNVVVVGADDAGVPSLLSALAQERAERTLVIEREPELTLQGSNVTRLMAGASPFETLLSRAARLRSERMVIDGVRGGGELHQALVTLASRGGSCLLGVRLAPQSALLDQLEANAGFGLGKGASLLGSAIHVVARMSRSIDGTRRVDAIGELGPDGYVELFEYGEGGFASTGSRPSFL